VASWDDSGSLELGLKFRAEVRGNVQAIRFYKIKLNTGPHTVSLWTDGGKRLAQATAKEETEAGWQQVELPSPVPIEADTLYVASYFAPKGHFARDDQYFSSSGRASPPLYAPSSAEVGGNGVFVYGPDSAFPDQSYNASNYWIDVVVTTSSPPDRR
jgi:hypothetical protein